MTVLTRLITFTLWLTKKVLKTPTFTETNREEPLYQCALCILVHEVGVARDNKHLEYVDRITLGLMQQL